MAKYKWADRYQKEGFSVFDAESVKSLQLIQRKYSQDFKQFFAQIDDAYAGTKFTAERKQVNEVIQNIDEINFLVGKLLSATSIAASEEETQRLANLMEEVDSAFKFFSDPNNLSAPLQKKIQDVEKKSGIKAQDISRANRAIKGRLSEAARPGKGLSERYEPYAPVLKPLADTVGSVAKKMLGPFGTIADVGGKAVSGLARMGRIYREQRKEKSRRALTQSTLLAGEDTPEAFAQTYKQLGGGGVGRIRQDIGGLPKISGGKKSSGLGGIASSAVSALTKGKVEREQQDSIRKSLFLFFTRDAYRARWTKELLEGVTGKSVKGAFGLGKGNAKGGMLGSIGESILGGSVGAGLATLGTRLAALGSTIGTILLWATGIGFAALAGTGAGLLIKKFVPQVSGESLVAGKVFSILNKRKEKEFQKNVAPVQYRALELQKQGMSISDSVRQAHAEFNQPLQWDSKGNTLRKPLPEDWKTYEKSSNPLAPKKEEVPISTPDGSGIVAEIKTMNKDFKGSVDAMNDNIKKIGGGGQKDFVSGFDAYNTRDPLLSGLNAGILGTR